MQSFNIKTNSSVSLPVWSCNLGIGEDARWPKVVEEEKAAETVPSGVDEAWSGLGGEAPQEEATTVKAKGKRKAAEAEEDAPVKVKKARKSKEAKATDPVTSAEPTPETPSIRRVHMKKERKRAAKELLEQSKNSGDAPLGPDASVATEKAAAEALTG